MKTNTKTGIGACLSKMAYRYDKRIRHASIIKWYRSFIRDMRILAKKGSFCFVITDINFFYNEEIYAALRLIRYKHRLEMKFTFNDVCTDKAVEVLDNETKFTCVISWT